MEVDLHQLDLRYASLRAQQPHRERQLLADLAEHGQRQPLVVVLAGETTFSVIDGYKRVRALERLGRDTACVLVWDLNADEALVIERLMRSGETDSPIEQGWLLRELGESHGLSQVAIAKRFGKSVSWVSRRLSLVESLPPQLANAVAQGRISPYAASKYLVPLARANSKDTENIVQAIAGKSMSTRNIEQLVSGYQSASPEVRARMIADPQLYLRAQAIAQEPPDPTGRPSTPTEAVRLALVRLTAQVGRCQHMLAEHAGRLTECQRQQAREIILGIEQAVAVLIKVAETDIEYARPKHPNGHPQVA